MNRFQGLVVQLIDENRLHRAEMLNNHPGLIQEMGMVAFGSDFCTVRADIGRRSGKSEFITRMAQQIPNSKIVVANLVVKRMIFHRDPRCLVPNDLLLQDNDKFSAKVVFVDEPSAVFYEMPVSTLYRVFQNDGDTTFVLLGA